MEKFLLRGKKSDSCLQIKVPCAKIYQPVTTVKDAETNLYPMELITKAVKRRKVFNHYRDYDQCHIDPGTIIGNDFLMLPKTLQQLLSPHPFPLSQGPLILPLDLEIDKKVTVDHIIATKTIFNHSPSQPCGLWAPTMIGMAAWTSNTEESSFSVQELTEMSIAGVSSMMDMSLVYTCQLHKCLIKCPCNVCRKPRGKCCKTSLAKMSCKMCSSQCPIHQITVPRQFNPLENLFTIVTDRMTKYRYAHGYAGIPKTCEHCVSDLLEHQVLHLVTHELCRFCRFEGRPLEIKNSAKSLKKFIEAEKEVHSRDKRTCGVCLLESKNESARKIHEAIVHKQTSQKFKCTKCPKSYVSQSSLDYHSRKHQSLETVESHICALCGKKFTTLSSLDMHMSTIHVVDRGDPRYACEECEKKFESSKSLKRHVRESHFNLKFNIDFHEGLENLKKYECEKCDQTFKRAELLRRHVSYAHKVMKRLVCTICGKEFGRPDNLKRHIKKVHGGNVLTSN